MVLVAGGEHTLHHDKKDGSIKSTGACGLGWCRTLPLNQSLFQFRPVSLPEPCSMVHASYYHNLAVGANTGTLYSWGCGTFTDGKLDGAIPALGQGKEAMDVGGKPMPILNPGREGIIGIAGGAYHSAVWMRTGKILTFGANQLGQLGRETRISDASGLSVDPVPGVAKGIPPDETIRSVAASFYNTLVICKSGSLFCAGENQNQQCGQGENNLRVLTKVKEVEDRAEQAEGGYCHTLIKTLGGRVLSLGCGDDGQRGDGRREEEEDEKSTVISEIDLPCRAVQVAAGANHSVVLGSNGIAYTFGANDVGQCGVDSDRSTGEEAGSPVWTPKPVVLPSHAGKVVHVSAGYAHTAITTQSGKHFVFGQNDNGQLGIGTGTCKNNFNPDVNVDPQTRPIQIGIQN